jgi:glyoxylase-like metal-dependent hydrolase (beta-lactamase superfamily II)
VKSLVFFLLALPFLGGPPAASAAEARFQKVTDHCYWLQLQVDGPGYSAIVTESGVLLINPPAQPELSALLGALKKVTLKPVLWVVNTDYLYCRHGGSAELARQGALILQSRELRRLAGPAVNNTPAAGAGSSEQTGAAAVEKTAGVDEEVTFERQIHLFPDNLEVRIFAVQFKAHTAGDVVIFVPAEKLLVAGDLFTAGSYPEIDREGGGGTALGWLDGIRQVIEAVPLLKSAMPQPKPDPTKPPPEEKTLEEQVIVVAAHGTLSNLQDVKNLFESAHKLRNELARAAASARGRDNILTSQTLTAHRGFYNLDPFAAQLLAELVAQKAK